MKLLMLTTMFNLSFLAQAVPVYAGCERSRRYAGLGNLGIPAGNLSTLADI
jgi:hypothetical protein